MAYQVLARKWRPQQFKDLIGQATIVQALTHALTSQRLHHAYLFTGTRGIGKTTIARIIAKCLNCESGISATPCGQCGTCQSIEQGRFVDLIEVDAASKTKVEDTRELLENVMYAPTQGRYKIYLIDEVHMLSTHSFNALLKTLEEPPPHVIFLLATTDPQKLPITVLSRCLQFQLQALTPALLTPYLQWILEQETISFETRALTLLAQAAKGSVRDSLSLLDQVIATGNGSVKTETVQQMLGIQGQHLIFPLMKAILEKNLTIALELCQQLAFISANFEFILDQLLQLLHDISIKQLAPDFTLDSLITSNEDINSLATLITADEIQVVYQIALLAKRDIALAPSADTGFQMTIMRMVAFRIKTQDTQIHPPAPQKTTTTSPQKTASEGTLSGDALKTPKTQPSSSASTQALSDWHHILPHLGLTALTKAFAEHLSLERQEAEQYYFSLPETHAALLQERHRQKLTEALTKYLHKPIVVHIQLGKSKDATPSMVEHRAEQTQQKVEEALNDFQRDPQLQKLIRTFDGKLLPNTLKLHE